jgi:hypothetical protein
MSNFGETGYGQGGTNAFGDIVMDSYANASGGWAAVDILNLGLG